MATWRNWRLYFAGRRHAFYVRSGAGYLAILWLQRAYCWLIQVLRFIPRIRLSRFPFGDRRAFGIRRLLGMHCYQQTYVLRGRQRAYQFGIVVLKVSFTGGTGYGLGAAGSLRRTWSIILLFSIPVTLPPVVMVM